MVGVSARKAAEINRSREIVFREMEDNCREAEDNCWTAAGNFRTAAEVCRAGICPPGTGNSPPYAAFSSPPAANGDLSSPRNFDLQSVCNSVRIEKIHQPNCTFSCENASRVSV